VSAFLCGTFALALGLVLVLDPDDDDDDQPVVLTTVAAPESRAPAVQGQAQKKLKVAKSSKLKPKKTAFKKRSKRVFQLNESAPPLQSSQRTRRGFAPTPYVVLPQFVPQLDAPHLTEARLLPGPSALPHASPQIRQQLIRGPPLSVRS
jgi:hypothetical protein